MWLSIGHSVGSGVLVFMGLQSLVASFMSSQSSVRVSKHW